MQEAPIALISDRVASKVGEEYFVQVSRSMMAEKYLQIFFLYTYIKWTTGHFTPCCACARGVKIIERALRLSNLVPFILMS